MNFKTSEKLEEIELTLNGLLQAGFLIMLLCNMTDVVVKPLARP